MALDWKITAPGNAISDPANASVIFAPGLRGFTPLAPVHLNTSIEPGADVTFGWIRRDRINADTWSDGEIPMSEAEEKYAVTVKTGSNILRQWEVGASPLIYTRADQLVDIASFPANLTFDVTQVSAVYGPGIVARLPFVLES